MAENQSMRASALPGDERAENLDEIYVEIQPNNNMRTGSVINSSQHGVDLGSPRAS